MKNYKSLICILLAIAMIFALSACGSDDKASGELDKSDVAEPSGTTDVSTDADIDEEFDIGTVSGGKYENKFFGFGCDLDSSWTYASEEELVSMLDTTTDQFTDENYREQLKNADMFYDMMVQSGDGYANVNVVVQNIGVMYGALYSEEEIAKANAEELPDQVASAGMEVQSCELTTVQFAGAERNAVSIHSIYEGYDLYQLAVIVKNGSYVGVVTITSFMEDITSNIAELFYAV